LKSEIFSLSKGLVVACMRDSAITLSASLYVLFSQIF
jgi:hypothetical protein